MPRIGVAHADGDLEEVEQNAHPFEEEQEPFVVAHKLGQFGPIAPCDEGAGHGQQSQPQQERALCVPQPAQTGHQPAKVGDEEQGEDTAEGKSPIGEAGEQHKAERKGEPSQSDNGQPPDYGRHKRVIGQHPIHVKNFAECAVCLLDSRLFGRKLHGVGGVGRFQWVHGDDVGHVYGSQNGHEAFEAKVGRLLKNPDGGMVVDAERLLSGRPAGVGPADLGLLPPAHHAARVADVQWPHANIAVELGDEFKAQLFGEQRLEIAVHERVGEGQAGSGPDGALTAEDDVIRFFEPAV